MQPEYMGRIMRCYPIHEAEIENLSTLNADATTYASVASVLLGFAFGILTNLIFTEKLTPVAKVASFIGAPVLVFLAAVFGWLWLSKRKRRASAWERIKSESASRNGQLPR